MYAHYAHRFSVNTFTNQKLADFRLEYTMFTDQRELVNQNFPAASVRRNETQTGDFIVGVLFLSPQFPSPRRLLHRLQCENDNGEGDASVHSFASLQNTNCLSKLLYVDIL